MATQDRQRPTSFLRRYKWSDLSDPEKEAVKDSAIVASTRAAVGLGVVFSTAAMISSARRGKPPLPRSVRYGAVPFFSIVGAYVGILSGGPLYARRILSVPNSALAEDLRIVIGDWDARVPSNSEMEQSGPHAELPGGVPTPDQDMSTLPGPERTKRKPRKDL